MSSFLPPPIALTRLQRVGIPEFRYSEYALTWPSSVLGGVVLNLIPSTSLTTQALNVHGFAIPRPGRNYWREVPNSGHAALKSFTPQLFTICMGTGILSVLMYNNPYQFRGLQVIAVVFWLIDLVLFISICTIFVLRWIWFTKSTARMFESEVEQTTYLSTTTIAASTIVEMISLVCGSTWKNWQYASFAFWWATVLLALISATTTYWLLIRDEQVSIANLSPTLLYPTTGLLATASAGSVLVSYTTLSVRLAVPVVIVSYLLLGAGLFLCILTLSAYFLRLLHNQTPSPSKIGAQLIPVAALANAAYSFSSLGYVVGIKKHLFEDYPGGSGSLGDPMVGKGIYASGFLLGLTIWGFATFWLILAIVSFVRDVPKTNFNLNMWSAAYPLGIYGIASSQFATDLQSTAFSVVSSATLVTAVLYWAYLVIYTLPMVFTGSLFLHDAHEELEKEKRDRENASENSKMETAGQSDHFAGESRNASSGQIQETSDLPIARRSRTRQSDDTQV